MELFKYFVRASSQLAKASCDLLSACACLAQAGCNALRGVDGAAAPQEILDNAAKEEEERKQ